MLAPLLDVGTSALGGVAQLASPVLPILAQVTAPFTYLWFEESFEEKLCRAAQLGEVSHLRTLIQVQDDDNAVNTAIVSSSLIIIIMSFIMHDMLFAS
jgi:hypothetical protein